MLINLKRCSVFYISSSLPIFRFKRVKIQKKTNYSSLTKGKWIMDVILDYNRTISVYFPLKSVS